TGTLTCLRPATRNARGESDCTPHGEREEPSIFWGNEHLALGQRLLEFLDSPVCYLRALQVDVNEVGERGEFLQTLVRYLRASQVEVVEDLERSEFLHSRIGYLRAAQIEDCELFERREVL